VANLRIKGNTLHRLYEIKNDITKSVFMLKKKSEKNNFLYKLKNQRTKKNDALLDIRNKKKDNLDPSFPIKNLKNEMRSCLEENILKKNKVLRLRLDTNICKTKEKKLSEKKLATEVYSFLSTLYKKKR
jgi:hypothetical protein